MSVTWKSLAVFAALLGTFALVAADERDWWKTTVFYQIYPRSFKDSDGDGIGDLKGIFAELDHLKDLGVGGVWLSPIFKSPMVDFGYDVSDYKKIEPLFGTMDDFDLLMRKARRLGIKVILDFVPNHTSDDHEWFKGSYGSQVDYLSYYIWRSPKPSNETTTTAPPSDSTTPEPPNDWVGAFSESVWTWSPYRHMFYYHRYDSKQPDLNYRNSDVRDEMKDILRFWLDKGVNGFRVDSIQTLVEDDTFPDVPDSEKDIYCVNQPMTYDIVREWRQILDEYTDKDNDTRVMMLEAFGTQDELLAYYGNETHPGAHFTFNFGFITPLNNESKAQDYVDSINRWIENVPNNSAPNWVIGNHDNSRVASRFGTDLAAGIAMLSLLLPGIGVIYNGEEIGMVNNWDISYDDTQDPAGIHAGEDGYLTASRDFERTPFQWDNTKDAGFSSASKTWLPVNTNFKQLNLAKEKTELSSYYNLYKSLMMARETETIMKGSLSSAAVKENVVAISRDLEGAESYLVVVNLGDNEETVDLNAAFGKSLPTMDVFTSNVAANVVANETVDTSNLVLQPKASIVLVSSGSTILIANLISIGFCAILVLFNKQTN